MPVSVNAHQHQLPATPWRRTMSVTRVGVSLLKVVATSERPASHHGTERPEAKNSDVFFPARFAKNSAGKKQMNRVNKMMTQSMNCRCMRFFYSGSPENSARCYFPKTPKTSRMWLGWLGDGSRAIDDGDHQHRAIGVKHETEASSRGSMHPGVGVSIFLAPSLHY